MPYKNTPDNLTPRQVVQKGRKEGRTMKAGKFNGHRDWHFWNVSLWINNDEGLYNLARECCMKRSTKADAALDFIGVLKDEGITKTPDGATYTVPRVRAAMRGM